MFLQDEDTSVFSLTFDKISRAWRNETHSLVLNFHISTWVWVAKSLQNINLQSPPGPGGKSILSSQAQASFWGRSAVLYHVDD